MNVVKVGLPAAVVLLLIGCAFFGVTKPQGFEETTLYVQSGVAVAQEALKGKINAKTISKRDAINTDAQLDNAVEGLDIAIQLRQAGDPAAEGKLETAAAIVAAIRKQLGV